MDKCQFDHTVHVLIVDQDRGKQGQSWQTGDSTHRNLGWGVGGGRVEVIWMKVGR